VLQLKSENETDSCLENFAKRQSTKTDACGLQVKLHQMVEFKVM